jgi:hypothetical protein
MLNSRSTKTRRKSFTENDEPMVAYTTGHLRLSEIAARVGVSQSTLSMRAKALGLPQRKRGRWKQSEPPLIHRQVIQQTRAEPYEVVGRRFGFSKQRVHQILKRWSDWSETKDSVSREGETVVVDKRHDKGVVVDNRHVVSVRVNVTKKKVLNPRAKLTIFEGSHRKRRSSNVVVNNSAGPRSPEKSGNDKPRS